MYLPLVVFRIQAMLWVECHSMVPDVDILANPRVAAITEHLARVKWFLDIAVKPPDAIASFRLLMAGVYFARGAVEIMLDAAECGELKQFTNPKGQKKNYNDAEAQIQPMLPNYELIERIRIHDFHRHGCLPPYPGRSSAGVSGRIAIHIQKGQKNKAWAQYSLPATGPTFKKRGGASLSGQRELVHSDGRYFDEHSKGYLSLDQILKPYIEALPAVIKWFENSLIVNMSRDRDVVQASEDGGDRRV